MQYTSAIMLKSIAALIFVFLVALQPAEAHAAVGKTTHLRAKTVKAGETQEAATSDSENPIAGQDTGPTFIYNTQKEQQKDKWDKAAIISYYALAGVGLIAVVMGGLLLRRLKRQTDVLEQTVILQHRPRLQIRQLELDLEAREVAFMVANSGGSKAFVSSGKFLVARMAGATIRASLFEDVESVGDFYLQPGEEQRCFLVVDERTALGLDSGSGGELIVAGVVKYRDTLGIERSTGVHRRLDAEAGSFLVVAGSDAEYGD